MTIPQDLTANYAVVLVTCNRASSLRKVLEAVDAGNWSFSSFVIVDNNSLDETAEVLRSYQGRSNFHVIQSPSNAGHGAGIAMALRFLANSHSRPEYVLFLEDDSIPNTRLPEILLAEIRNSGFDLISPDGYQVRIGRRIQLRPEPGQMLAADFCLFDGAIMRFDVVLSIGYPAEDWFMMADDYEYCFRIRRAGFRIGAIHNSFHDILHYGGGGGFTRSTLWRGYYQSRNHVFFLKRYFTPRHLLDFILLQGKRFLAAFTAPDRVARVRLRIIGTWHGLMNQKGRLLDPVSLRFYRSEINRNNFIIPPTKGLPAKNIFLLCSKSSGSSAFQQWMVSRFGVRLLPFTSHYERETLLWTKAASALSLPQDPMHRSVVPYSRAEGREEVNRLMIANGLGPLDGFSEETIFYRTDELTSLHGPVFFEKSPHHLYNLSNVGLMVAYLRHASSRSDGHLVAIIRNPLDTVYSGWRRWRYRCSEFEQEWFQTYSNLELLRKINPGLPVFRYEDLVEDDTMLETWGKAIGLSTVGSEFRFHRGSIRKWEQYSGFLYSLRPETIELAERFGYARETMVNPRGSSLRWAMIEWARDVWFRSRRATRFNRLKRLRS